MPHPDRSHEDRLKEKARLTMLQTLARETAGRASAEALNAALDEAGTRRTEAYARQELRHMAEVGGVKLFETGVRMVAEITREGLDHVARRSILEGVARPLPGDE